MTFENGAETGEGAVPERSGEAAGGTGRKPTFSAFYRAVFVMALLWPLEWAIFGNLFKDNPHGGKIVDAIVLATFLLTWYLIRRALRSENRAPSSHPA
jgi:hypothetical protein